MREHGEELEIIRGEQADATKVGRINLSEDWRSGEWERWGTNEFKVLQGFAIQDEVSGLSESLILLEVPL